MARTKKVTITLPAELLESVDDRVELCGRRVRAIAV
jgi:metal-responsive CopG/Arc/MetJ family transcriptional regulator